MIFNWRTFKGRLLYLFHSKVENLKVFLIRSTKGKEAVQNYHIRKISECQNRENVVNDIDVFLVINRLYTTLEWDVQDCILLRDIFRAMNGFTDDVEFREGVTEPFIDELVQQGVGSNQEGMKPYILKWLQVSDDLKGHQVLYHEKVINEWLRGCGKEIKSGELRGVRDENNR